MKRMFFTIMKKNLTKDGTVFLGVLSFFFFQISAFVDKMQRSANGKGIMENPLQVEPLALEAAAWGNSEQLHFSYRIRFQGRRGIGRASRLCRSRRLHLYYFRIAFRLIGHAVVRHTPPTRTVSVVTVICNEFISPQIGGLPSR